MSVVPVSGFERVGKGCVNSTISLPGISEVVIVETRWQLVLQRSLIKGANVTTAMIQESRLAEGNRSLINTGVPAGRNVGRIPFVRDGRATDERKLVVSIHLARSW